MENLILCKSGLWVSWWDGDARESRQRLVKPEEVIEFMNFSVDLEGEVSLGTLLSVFAKVPKNDLKTIGWFVDANISPYIAEFLKQPADTCGITVLEVYKIYEISKGYKKKGPYIAQRLRCTGREGTVKKPKGNWALDFTPINKLVNATVSVKEVAELVDDRKIARKRNVIGKYEVDWTFQEVCWAVFDELCFHGTPVQREEQKEEIDRRVEDVKAHPENSVPASKVFADLRKRSKEEAPRLEELRKKREAERANAPAIYKPKLVSV